MKQEIAMQWADALESGKYKQAKGKLHGEDDFCCLGVLCDLSGLGNWDPIDNYGMKAFQSGFSGELGVLVPEIVEWAGMATVDGYLNDDATLASLNDNGKTFTEIAAIIRENWKEL